MNDRNLTEQIRLEQMPGLMAEWHAYRRSVYGDGPLPPNQEDECRRCFFGGIAAGVNVFTNAADLPEETAMMALRRFHNEVRLVPELEFPGVIPPQFSQRRKRS